MSSPPMATLPAQPSGPPPLGDVNESVAVTLLAEMLRSKKINDRENEEHKQNYLVMHERVVETRAKEQALAKLVHTYCASRSTAPHTPAPVYTLRIAHGLDRHLFSTRDGCLMPFIGPAQAERCLGRENQTREGDGKVCVGDAGA